MAEAQKVQIQCPNCGTPFDVPIVSIIDVGQHPELRSALLSGQLNVAVCPNCQQTAMLEVPLVYHDPKAEFLAVYFPSQLNLPEMERQKAIGDLTQALMRSLPPEQRKGYFLSPRQFLNRQGLMDAILGTIGISQEELDRQRKKMKLLDQALVMVDDRKGLEMMAKAQDSQMDGEFFMILANAIEQTSAAGEEEDAKKLLDLREKLMKLTTWGKKAARQQEAIASLDEVKTRDELLDRIIAADPETVDAMAVAVRPMMDYEFFQSLSERIGGSQGAERDRLTKLRERLLKITQDVDEVTRAAYREASDLLNDIMQAPEPRSAVREHLDEINDVFMSVLAMNLQEAERRQAREAQARLQMIWEEIMQVMEEGMPPEVRLINALLRAPYPDETRKLLKERQAQITPELLSVMDRLAEDLTERQDAESAKRLRDIKAQAMLLA
jgi:hypothetical protein